MRKKVFAVIFAIILVLAVVLVINRHWIWMVACNLTSPDRDLGNAVSWEGGKTYLNVAYGTESDNQYLDLYVPEGDELFPLLIIVHGGGFVSNDARSKQARFMYEYFRDQGYVCASINYRLADEGYYPTAIEDVKAAIRFLGQHGQDYGYDIQQVAIFGESAGGYLAAMAALSAPEDFSDVLCVGETESQRFPEVHISTLLDYYGVMDLSCMAEQFREEGVPQLVISIANSWASTAGYGFDTFEENWINLARENWGDEQLLHGNVIWQAGQGKNENTVLKTLIYHGDADITVPYLQSVALEQTLKQLYGKDAVSFRTFHGYRHADDRMYSDEVLKEVEQFLAENIK